VRWWDGWHWTAWTIPAATGWRPWITNSGAAWRINRWLFRVDGLFVMVFAVMLGVTVLGRQPITWFPALVVPAVPVLFFGQVWVILLLNVRMGRPQGGWRARFSAHVRMQVSALRFFFPSLPKMQAYGLTALVFLAWLGGMAAFPALSQGGPVSAVPGCQWPLENHGSVTCVSYSQYQQAGAAGKQLAAGVLTFFFVIHAGVTLDETVRRRKLRDELPVVVTQ